MSDKPKGGDGQAGKPKPTLVATSAQDKLGQQVTQMVVQLAGEHGLTLVEAVAILQFAQHDLCHIIAQKLAEARRQGGIQVAGSGFLGQLRKPGEGG